MPSVVAGRAFSSRSAALCAHAKSSSASKPEHGKLAHGTQLERQTASVHTPEAHDDVVSVRWKDGHEGRFLSFWLRDHCPCPQCHHGIPLDIRPQHTSVEHEQLHLEWPDGHQSVYHLGWLREQMAADMSQADSPTLWDANLADHLPTVPYEKVMHSEQGVQAWLENIERYGIGIVDGVPGTPEHTEQLAQRISHIRVTHYGGFWDFTADMAHGDTAYTPLALQLHTDNTYFTDPAGLQMFHMLRAAEQGGESTFLDGFHAARQLLKRHPDAYQTLSYTRTDAAARGDDGVYLRPAHPYPILNHLPQNTPGDKSARVGRLFQVRYNNDDRAPLQMTTDETRAYYLALRYWQERVRDPANVLRLSLQPGRVVCFDNWRVLHGREAFTGQRRLCGAYIGADDWRSRLRALRERAHGTTLR
ncbi:hypothetical protein THASP1DRAFT_29338 [Thamnocephalis sphaerospora]|uniref:trimethyllysine dioxygenase n=1 Tax=Thamnocephalis sphaerospora TaxID=78915 RepID=A0A4P9XRZ7_9FUNG|nr:hypothetical protein THASP1DRAFT_29338 [Thamnocephalis sphaerospora]|eukprot:RKP08875.1 hypothetical protein THASP1DRAFT_29338 [Thamnocephalis sphaerospora]